MVFGHQLTPEIRHADPNARLIKRGDQHQTGIRVELYGAWCPATRGVAKITFFSKAQRKQRGQAIGNDGAPQARQPLNLRAGVSIGFPQDAEDEGERCALGIGPPGTVGQAVILWPVGRSSRQVRFRGHTKLFSSRSELQTHLAKFCSESTELSTNTKAVDMGIQMKMRNMTLKIQKNDYFCIFNIDLCVFKSYQVEKQERNRNGRRS
jgi:hypothetical protein